MSGSSWTQRGLPGLLTRPPTGRRAPGTRSGRPQHTRSDAETQATVVEVQRAPVLARLPLTNLVLVALRAQRGECRIAPVALQPLPAMAATLAAPHISVTVLAAVDGAPVERGAVRERARQRVSNVGAHRLERTTVRETNCL